jgi:hypothetical protein
MRDIRERKTSTTKDSGLKAREWDNFRQGCLDSRLCISRLFVYQRYHNYILIVFEILLVEPLISNKLFVRRDSSMHVSEPQFRAWVMGPILYIHM